LKSHAVEASYLVIFITSSNKFWKAKMVETCSMVNVDKVKLTHYRPTEFQEVKAPRFLDIGT
jgi:hypothetical protein